MPGDNGTCEKRLEMRPRQNLRGLEAHSKGMDFIHKSWDATREFKVTSA